MGDFFMLAGKKIPKKKLSKLTLDEKKILKAYGIKI